MGKQEAMLCSAWDTAQGETMSPYSAILDGQGPASWGCGRTLLARKPSALLWVGSSGEVLWLEGKHQRNVSGALFELLEHFCEEHLGEEADGRHVVAAISYEAGRAGNLLPPATSNRWPLLLAAAYQPPEVIEAVSCKVEPRGLVCADPGMQGPGPRLHGLAAELKPTWDAERHCNAVRRALEYIAAGDVYQVNLAYPWRCAERVPALALFETLQRGNPVPYGAYFRCGPFELVVNSPECLLRRRGRWVETWPIKGTRPRGASIHEDEALREELLADPKEQAELVMIVDLERNDLGRVCDTGSVQVIEHAKVCSFERWHHLQSVVRGRLRADVSWSAVLAALLPGGSVTGAPKRRAMQIIDELEGEPRGFYTGALGWFRSRCDADFALTIRTAIVGSAGLEYWTGGGIVADSVPEREYAETWLKALPLRNVLEAWRGEEARW